MLSSLLTLYIAASLSPELSKDPDKLVKLASTNLSSIISSSTTPIKNAEFISPIVNAKSSIALDLKSNSILYEKNLHQRMPVASITKLMTALIILQENQPDEIVTVSRSAAVLEGSTMFLQPGEQITVGTLLNGAMIHSANDAALALAEYNSGTVQKFVEKMNAKALEMGLINTHFSNPVGLDESKNYSSAYDIAKLAQEVYKNPFIKKTATIKNLTVQSVSGDYTHKLESTNDLLGNEFFKIKGLKTGSTDRAGLCFVAIAENSEGHEIVTVVLNSPARFTETKILVDWVFRAYNW